MSMPTAKQTAVFSAAAKYPTASNRKLARMLAAEYPDLFNSYETARSSIRYMRGQYGSTNRLKNRALRLPPEPCIPEPKPNEVKDPIIIDEPGVWGVLSDTHIPYHDKQAIEIAVKHLKKRGVTGVYLNGDVPDARSISRHERDPDSRNLAQELKSVKQFLEYVADEFHKSRLIYKLGNHDDWFRQYVNANAPELAGLDGITLESALELSELGYEVVEQTQYARFGALSVIHGHEYRFNVSNPVNPARGLYLRAKVHSLCGHHHQISQHSEPDLHGKVVSCFSTGCLCNLHPRYMPYNKHAHGFAIIELDKKGAFDVANLRIVDGDVY